MSIFFLIAAIILLVVGLSFYLRGQRTYEQTGLPSGGEIIYQDTAAPQRVEHEVSKPLFSRQFMLAGKPDYLVEENGEIVPVEIKSGNAPTRPYESHVMQLAAYCLLVTEVYGQRPSHGIIRYQDRHFTIAYDEVLEQSLYAVIDAMRSDALLTNVPRNHAHPGKCKACSVRDYCTDALL